MNCRKAEKQLNLVLRFVVTITLIINIGCTEPFVSIENFMKTIINAIAKQKNTGKSIDLMDGTNESLKKMKICLNPILVTLSTMNNIQVFTVFINETEYMKKQLY